MTETIVTPRGDKVRALVAAANCGEPVGFIALRERTSDAPCPEGCFAPGSSPHFHTRIVGWELFGTTGRLTMNADMSSATRATMVRPFEALDTDPYLVDVALDI